MKKNKPQSNRTGHKFLKCTVWSDHPIAATIAFIVLAVVALSSCAGLAGSGAPAAPGSSGRTLSTTSSSVNFGKVSVGRAVTQSVTVTNSGTASVSISQASVSGAGFSVLGNVAGSLEVGKTTTIKVQFLPQSAKAMTGNLSVVSNAADSPLAIKLNGTGITSTASLSVSPSAVSFGNVTVGQSSTENLTLTNNGSSSVTVNTATVSGAGFSINGLSLPVTLAAGHQTTFHAVFSPNGATESSGSISVTDTATSSPLVITLGGTGIASTASLSVSPSTVSFGNVAVGQSLTENVTLTDSGSLTVSVSAATVSGAGFSIKNLLLPLTLSVGGESTFQVVFSPTSASEFSGSISVTDTATGSPTVITLSGTGTTSGGGSAACTGEAVEQSQTDVSSSLGIASGVTVTQLTNAASPLITWNTYADVPVNATATSPNVIVANYGTNPNGITIANADGTGAQKINGAEQGIWAIVSVDGKYVAYQGGNSDNTMDLYGINLTASGTCVPANLSNLHLSLTAPATALIYSTSQIDPTTGNNVFAFSEGNTFRTVESDGSHLQAVSFADSENAQVFHRFRLNPVFQNKVWYKRDAVNPNPNGTATPEIWVVDTTRPTTVYNAAIVGGAAVPADHNSWSPDGMSIGFTYQGLWYTLQVLNSDGTWVNGGNFGSATLVGPPAASGLAVDYCSWAPDSSEYVCTRGPKNTAPTFGGEVYLMSLDGKTTVPLVYTDSTGTVDDGIPKAHFGDMQHIYFSSDRSGTPQLYVITGFTNIAQ